MRREGRELTDGRGVDCVVEIGGPGTIAKSLKALAVGGHVSLIGGRVVRHFMPLRIGRANVFRIEGIRTGTLLVG